VYSLGLAVEIQIERADHDAGVIRRRAVQPNEIPAIQGENGALLACRESEDHAICQILSRLAKIAQRDNILTVVPQRLDNWKREVLVRKEAPHRR
jgi:hypothetical protein